jgi:hypothetical protein
MTQLLKELAAISLIMIVLGATSKFDSVPIEIWPKYSQVAQ